MKNLLLTLSITALLTSACTKEPPPGAFDLKVEYGQLVVDDPNPRFSWILSDTSRGAIQSAYQVLVASSPKKLSENKADTWNSNKTDSDQSVFVSYGGKPLEGGKRYYWTVRTWDHDGNVCGWSNPAYFDMGLDPSQWQAGWVGSYASEAKTDTTRPRSIMLRNEWNIKKTVKIAKAYVTGLGSYQLFLNGKKVSPDLLTPGWTDYPSRIMYQVYDVTDMLVKGENAAGILLGNVWYSSGLGWRGGSAYSDGPLMALLQVEIEYENGDREIITTDDTWKWQFSPITENTLYHGETYDARLEIEGWSEPGIEESAWQPVDVFDKRNAALSAHTSPPIRITRELKPVSRKKLYNGAWVFDMGVNMTGGIRLKVEGTEGTEIVMKFAELLHEDGSVAQENLRSAKATDRYILKGGGTETWEPAFTYHGFRYIEIHGLPVEPDDQTVTGLNFHNAAKETGTFECSNELLNQIQTNIQNGQRSNMFSVPTDCPQRDERLGWMGDAQIFAATSCYNMDMSGFYAKWVRDIADSQSEEGWVTDVNPAIVVTNPAKPAWGDAFLIVPWEMYRFYRDTRILERFYPDYREWVEYMRGKANEDGLYIFNRNGDLGYADWIAVVESPKKPISAAYYFFSTKLLSTMAEILGYEEDMVNYGTLADSIRQTFQEKFFIPKTASYEGGTQTALLLPLNFGITPQDQKAKVAENIFIDVVKREYHPSTGFLGTKYLLPTLSDYGYHEAAFQTAISTTYPSWGYMAVNGATSMWELWNSDSEPPDKMNSRNHFALGSVGEWYYSHLAGIRIDDAEPGFRHSVIAPMPVEGLTWAKGEIETPYGKLLSSWKMEKDIFTLEVHIPPNTWSTINIPIPEGNRLELYEGGNLLVSGKEIDGSVKGISDVNVNEGSIQLNAVSGTYKFELLY